MILSAFSLVRSIRTYFSGRPAARLAAGAELSTRAASFEFDTSVSIEEVPQSATVVVERRAPRIQAPLVWRPAGFSPFARGQRDRHSAERVSAYSDVCLSRGTWVEIEVFPRDGTSITFVASVLRATPLTAPSPAQFDLVFEIQSIDADGAANLATVLV
jgi:hypothetical protein